MGVPATGNPSGGMRSLINKAGVKAIGAYPKVDVGSKSYPEHSGWTDETEVRKHGYRDKMTGRGACILERMEFHNLYL